MTLTTSQVSGSTAASGGMLYVDMVGGDVNFNVGAGCKIDSSSAVGTSGGVGLLRSTTNAYVTTDGPATTISYSTAQGSGGVFYLDAAVINSFQLGVTADVSLTTSTSKTGEGGIAVMNGQQNTFTMSSSSSI